MSARTALTVTGQAIGSAFGPVGAAIGGMVGSGIGGAIDGPQRFEGNRLQDLRTPKLQYGAKWPRIYGRVRTAGIILWQSELEEVATETEQGGKGGPTAVSTNYTYYRSVLFGFAEFAPGATIKPRGVARIWRNGKLIWSHLPESDAATIEASDSGEHFDSFTFYDGNPDQLPDPIYEAAVGAENAIAYRTRSTGMLARINCGNSDQTGLFEFEVFTGIVTTTSEPVLVIGPWRWFGPNAHGPSGYDFATAADAANARLTSWQPEYTGGFGSCSDPRWFFLETLTQTPPSDEFIASQDGELGVQYLCSGAGQQGIVTAQVNYVSETVVTLDPGQTVDLADIAAEEHLRCNGRNADEFDYSALAGIPVESYACTGSGREAIEPLRIAFYFDVPCTGVSLCLSRQ